MLERANEILKINKIKSVVEYLYEVATDFPRRVFAMGLIFIGVSAIGLTHVEKDTSVEAFIPANHYSVQTRDQVKEIFGLKDPMILAVVSNNIEGIYTEFTLKLINHLHSQIIDHANIRYDRVFSIASEAAISGNQYGIQVDDYLDPMPASPDEINDLKNNLQSMPPHFGTLVSKDGSTAVIIAEVIDSDKSDQTYQSLLTLAEQSTEKFSLSSNQIEIHVAGQGAVAGYLGRYIDEDGRKLRPFAILIILLVLLLAFRRFKSLLAPILIIIGSTIGSLGIMGWVGIKYYAITTALPVILIAVSVADAIHILTRYYELTRDHPESAQKDRIRQSVSDMWRPITITTFTTVAGFLGITMTSIMPPITYFGIFAAVGILIAWLFSLTVLPATMMLLKLDASPSFPNKQQGKSDIFGITLTSISYRSAQNPLTILVVFFIATTSLLWAATNLTVDRSQIDNFQQDEPIYLADRALNERLAGTAYLDVIVESGEMDGLLYAHRIKKIAALQDFMSTLPHVQHTRSIADYIKLLHRAVEGEGELPNSDDAISQYLLMYETSGDPTDFEDKIDSDYQTALIRGVMNSRYTSNEIETVEKLSEYINNTFNELGMTAQLTGRVNIDYHWMKRLSDSHFLGVALALVLVLMCSTFLFKDPFAGLLSLFPSSFAIITVYALMAIYNIHLEVATSMFAAISVGLGVDYAIHLIERLRKGIKRDKLSTAESVSVYFPGGTRACFFNAAGLALGFLALNYSQLPTLTRFGSMIALAAFSSYIAALLVIPAAYALIERIKSKKKFKLSAQASVVSSLLFIFLLFAASTDFVYADNRADEIVKSIQNRVEGNASRREINMTLVDRRGKSRQRTAEVHRTEINEIDYALIRYTAPKRIRHTAFLSHDKVNDNDERWLYLPVTKKARRIPSSDRGDYFLGTDFTYQDINEQLKFDSNDYTFSYVTESTINGRPTHVINARPVSEKISKELGYGGLVAHIDEASWLPIEIDFVDPQQQPLKKVTVEKFEKIDGIWTPLKIEASNYQTGHKTIFEYTNIEYLTELDVKIFEPDAINDK